MNVECLIWHLLRGDNPLVVEIWQAQVKKTEFGQKTKLLLYILLAQNFWVRKQKFSIPKVGGLLDKKITSYGPFYSWHFDLYSHV